MALRLAKLRALFAHKPRLVPLVRRHLATSDSTSAAARVSRSRSDGVGLWVSGSFVSGVAAWYLHAQTQRDGRQAASSHPGWMCAVPWIKSLPVFELCGQPVGWAMVHLATRPAFVAGLVMVSVQSLAGTGLLVMGGALATAMVTSYECHKKLAYRLGVENDVLMPMLMLFPGFNQVLWWASAANGDRFDASARAATRTDLLSLDQFFLRALTHRVSPPSS